MKESDELLIDKLIEKFHELGFSKRYKPNGRFEKLHIVHYKDDDELEHFYDGIVIKSLIYSDDTGVLKEEISNQNDDEECVEAF